MFQTPESAFTNKFNIHLMSLLLLPWQHCSQMCSLHVSGNFVAEGQRMDGDRWGFCQGTYSISWG